MKITNTDYRREINCAIFHEMPDGQGHEILRRFEVPDGIPACEDWANRFCSAMATEPGPGAWHNYHCMFAIIEANLNLLYAVMLDHAELESEAELEVVQRLARLIPFLREVSTTHNTLWQEYLNPQAWQGLDGTSDLGALVTILHRTVRRLVPRARELDAILADWPQLIDETLVKSIGTQAILFDYTLASAYITQFPHNIVVQVDQIRKQVEAQASQSSKGEA